MMLTTTTTQLLSDLQDTANSSAWSELDSRYRPLLVRLAGRLGLAGDDADELAQQTLTEFCRAYREGLYQRERGRLRAWLIGIARNTALSMRRRRGAVRVGGNSALENLPDELEISGIWDREREQAIYEQAMAALRESTRTDAKTLLVFELYAIQGKPVDDVAAQCNVTVDMVYVIKNRLTKRLRELVAALTAAYDDGE